MNMYNVHRNFARKFILELDFLVVTGHGKSYLHLESVPMFSICQQFVTILSKVVIPFASKGGYNFRPMYVGSTQSTPTCTKTCKDCPVKVSSFICVVVL